VLPKRSDQEGGPELNGRRDDTPVLAQVLRGGSEPVGLPKPEKKDEERMSLFWRVFGGTILSIVALVGITVFNNLMAGIAELRADLARANEARANAIVELRTEIARNNEARAELIRKDEFNTRMSSNWDRIQALQQQNNTQNATITSLRTEIDGLKERLAKQGTDLEAARKDGGSSVEAVKKDVTATVEAIRKEVAALEVMKERLALIVADQKASREDLLKLRQDVDRNQSYDLERKGNRDLQYKQIDETLKELQKGLQDCREKLARLEGQTSPPAPATPKKGAGPRTTPAKSGDPPPETAPPPGPPKSGEAD
jgi:hypothetical protein